MKEQKKQYILTGLSWINILVLAPLFFFTSIYNAKVYALKIHTVESNFFFFAYAAQILLLLNIFVVSILLQLNIKREIKRQALMIVACESGMCFVYSLIQIFSHQHIKIYGWILCSFLTSYIGISLFILNIVGAIVYFNRLKTKKYITKFVVTNVSLFFVCLVYIFLIK